MSGSINVSCIRPAQVNSFKSNIAAELKPEPTSITRRAPACRSIRYNMIPSKCP